MNDDIPFNKNFALEPGMVETVRPGIRRLVANNPGPFTLKGTVTYIVGQGRVAIIDPGPDDDRHIAAVLRAVAGETVTHVLVTHTHRDHSPAVPKIKAATGAISAGEGPHRPAQIRDQDQRPGPGQAPSRQPSSRPRRSNQATRAERLPTTACSPTASCESCARVHTGTICRNDTASGSRRTRASRWAMSGVWEREFLLKRSEEFARLSALAAFEGFLASKVIQQGPSPVDLIAKVLRNMVAEMDQQFGREALNAENRTALFIC